MRKNLLILLAVVLAIGFSAFMLKKAEAPKQSARYAIYNLATPAGEINGANYSIQATQPVLPCPGDGVVCWFRFTDLNGDGLFTSADVAIRADQLDTDDDNIVSDNQADRQIGIYEEKL